MKNKRIETTNPGAPGQINTGYKEYQRMIYFKRNIIYILSLWCFLCIIIPVAYADCWPPCGPCNCCRNGNCISGCCDPNYTCCGTGANRGCCHTAHPCIDCISDECVVCDDNPCKFCCDEQECCDQSNCEICKDSGCERAVPTNMHETYCRDLGNGVLYFRYEWESTTGDPNDLYNCFEGEKVDYQGGNPYFWPSPPWAWDYCTPNPTTAMNPATWGGSQDTHYRGNIVQPYAEAGFSANQVYQYHCGPDCCMGDVWDRNNWETLLDIGPIIRCVSYNNGVWTYGILKSGEYAVCPLP
jgi:hypothetical protein